MALLLRNVWTGGRQRRRIGCPDRLLFGFVPFWTHQLALLIIGKLLGWLSGTAEPPWDGKGASIGDRRIAPLAANGRPLAAGCGGSPE